MPSVRESELPTIIILEGCRRVHNCPKCGYITNRDVAAAQVVRNRGILAVGQPVSKIASGGVLSGIVGNNSLGKCL